MRLDVGVLGAEKFLRALNGERLDDVDELAAAVIALTRIAFRVLVGEEPWASITASDVKFSEAISSMPSCWRVTSERMALNTAASCFLILSYTLSPLLKNIHVDSVLKKRP